MPPAEKELSGREEYYFLQVLVRLLEATSVLEVGTSAGQGTLAMASGMKSGTIVTVDIKDIRCPKLLSYQGNIKIDFRMGPSGEILPELVRQGAKFDLVFIDGWHHLETVKEDWENARQMTETVLFHDALQFHGVARVVDLIRNDPGWDVAVLSYPPPLMVDESSGKRFRAASSPGIAIATRRKKFQAQDYSGLPETPTKHSCRALKEKEARHEELLSDCPNDLSRHDQDMLLHTLHNFRPTAIIHAGHAGTCASLVFIDYALDNKIPCRLYDASGRFWARKANLVQVRTGLDAGKLQPMLITRPTELLTEVARENLLIWIDEYNNRLFYTGLAKKLISRAGKGSLICIRNFSPVSGNPEHMVCPEADCECTDHAAYDFAKWLFKQPWPKRLAQPAATFGDYVNAGHWLYVSR